MQKAIALREEQPARSANTIIEILRRDPAVPAIVPLKSRTLRGILQRLGKSRAALLGQSEAFRRFEREAANELWQARGADEWMGRLAAAEHEAVSQRRGRGTGADFAGLSAKACRVLIA